MRMTRDEMNAPWHTDTAADEAVKERYVYGERPITVIATTGKDMYDLIRNSPLMYECLRDLTEIAEAAGGTNLPGLESLVGRVKPILAEVEFCYEHQRAMRCSKYKFKGWVTGKPRGCSCSVCINVNGALCPRKKERDQRAAIKKQGDTP